LSNLCPRYLDSRRDILDLLRLYVLLWKINGGFKLSESVTQGLTDRADRLAETTLKLLTRKTQLLFALGINNIGDRLSLREIHLAVEKRALRELTRRRWKDAIRVERAQNLLHQHGASMELEFRDILTRETPRARHEHGESLIERRTRLKIDDIPKDQGTRVSEGIFLPLK
jgi:hypothetical protein